VGDRYYDLTRPANRTMVKSMETSRIRAPFAALIFLSLALITGACGGGGAADTPVAEAVTVTPASAPAKRPRGTQGPWPRLPRR